MSVPDSRWPLPAAAHQTSERPPNICPSGLPRPVSRDRFLPIRLTCLGFCIGVNRLGFALDHGGASAWCRRITGNYHLPTRKILAEVVFFLVLRFAARSTTEENLESRRCLNIRSNPVFHPADRKEGAQRI
jgi:hypothetical protein